MSRTPTHVTAPATSPADHTALRPQLAVAPNFLHVPANRAGALEAYMHLYVDGAAQDEAALAAAESPRRLN
jgi:hypothetical protein